MRDVVVDASVAAKWVVEEADSDLAARLLQCEARYAPDHWLAEAVNVLWSKVFKGDLAADDAEERMSTLLQAPVIGTAVADLMPRAFTLAVALRITVYDALYVALAEQKHVPLVTADRKLVLRLANQALLRQPLIWLGDLPAA